MSTMTHDERLKQYKDLIDQDITTYSQELLKKTEKEFGNYSMKTTESFVSVLARGGKRLRGVLTIASYEMLGGKDRGMIIRAARAIEMIHAYVLMIDDIADHSDTRRGGPSAHKIMQEYHHKNGLKNDDIHFGESMATQSALIGGYLAELVIDELDVSAEIKLSVLKNLHKNLVRTGHGQLRDILNEVLPEVTEDDAIWTAQYKTAYYTVINPLETGALLAGAPEIDLDMLRAYGIQAGIGFQIADDIMGIFGDSTATGKSSLDDLKEGKVTILMTHAMAKATSGQRRQLVAVLGNPHVTENDLKLCQNIIQDTGALAYASQKALNLASKATHTLDLAPQTWNPELVSFLRQMTANLVERKA
jgi:geranylgeranyl diphosphate synthase, type I